MPNKRHNNNNKRSRKPTRGNATTAIVRPSIPEEVRVRMRLGIYKSNVVNANTVFAQTINDPLTMVNNWSMRSAAFESYRVVGADIHIVPSVAASGTVSATDTRTYVTALVESQGPPVNPTNFVEIMELPQADVRPMNTANPRAHRRLRWRCRDLNGLIFTNTASAPLATSVTLFSSSNGSSPVTGWQFNISGYLDVEFKGIATL